ncbi:MAG: hypothetical protein RMK29_08185 [Myxococcales bacterium]|nr:hypothetical protein [Myxococcota bacterium]MDW8281672.1 hypothetical protein [Myxococcales bacterium]
MAYRVVALALCLAGCNSALEVSAFRAGIALRFDDTGCGIGYSGDRGAGPSAVDITCPANLRPRPGRPTLHISTPLVTPPGELPLRDEHFRQPGYQLGQFVVVTYEAGGRTITCDPRQATGALIYSSVPRPGTGGRLSGRFSDQAALLSCHTPQGPDGSSPLTLQGFFDLPAP